MEKKDVFIAVLQPEDESARQRAELLRKYVMPHKNLIYSICIKYTYNQEDIEDNYLEALANFFKYMDSYDPARPVKTWIYAVTKRLVADLNNRNRNRMPPDDNIDISEISSSLSDEDEPSGNSMGMDNYREFYNDDILWALDRLKPITGKPCSCSRLVTNSGKSWKSPITTVLCRPGT